MLNLLRTTTLSLCYAGLFLVLRYEKWLTAFEMWWHTRRNHISSFGETGRVHLNRPGGRRQFSRLLAAEVCASAVVMLDTPCSEVVWRVLATHSIRQFSLHFPSRALPCSITFQPVSKTGSNRRRHLIDRLAMFLDKDHCNRTLRLLVTHFYHV